MEAHKEKIIIPPAPKTVRGYPSFIDANDTHILCFNGNSVILRPLKVPHLFLTFSHSAEVAAAKISHDGKMLASIDVRGTLIISEICYDQILRVYSYEGIFPAAKQIDWSADRKKVCIVGQGKKKFAKVISVETGVPAGDIGSVTATLNSCSFRQERPFKLVMGGDEYTVKCFEGPPYTFVKSDKSHSGFINKVKYSPKGHYFLTGGADRKLVLYDGKSFQKIAEKENAHNGSIFGLDWISEDYFVTVSSDKLIKIWDINFYERYAIETVTPGDMKNPKKIGQFLVAVKALTDMIYVVNLQGDILAFDNPVLSMKSSLLHSYSGPRSKIVKFLPYDEHNLILLDNGGRVLLFNTQAKVSSVCAPEIEMAFISTGFLVSEGENKKIFVLTANGWIWIYEGNSHYLLKFIKRMEKTQFKNISKGKNWEQIVGVSNNKIVLCDVQTEKIERQSIVNEDVQCLSSNQQVILVGTVKGKVHVFSSDLQLRHTIALNTFQISHIALFQTSVAANFRCLIGDTCGNMRMIQLSSTEIKTVKETMGGHSSVLTGSGVDDKFLYTFSMDGKINVWQNQSLERISELKDIAPGGIVCGSIFGKYLAVAGVDLITRLVPK